MFSSSLFMGHLHFVACLVAMGTFILLRARPDNNAVAITHFSNQCKQYVCSLTVFV